MFGWRARIGLISPSPGGVPSSLLEMQVLAPEGVAFVTAFLDGPASRAVPDLVSLLPQIGPLTRQLASKADLDVVLMAGAPIVLANGPDRVIRILEEASGLPATTNVAGLVNGLRRLDMHKLVVVTPYYPQTTVDMLETYLLETGFRILSMVSGGDVLLGKTQELAPEQTYRLAKRAFLAAPSADGLLIVGGGAPLHAVIESLEADIGKPVVANNFASLWSALTLANVRQPIRGYGKLLACF